MLAHHRQRHRLSHAASAPGPTRWIFDPRDAISIGVRQARPESADAIIGGSCLYRRCDRPSAFCHWLAHERGSIRKRQRRPRATSEVHRDRHRNSRIPLPHAAPDVEHKSDSLGIPPPARSFKIGSETMQHRDSLTSARGRTGGQPQLAKDGLRRERRGSGRRVNRSDHCGDVVKSLRTLPRVDSHGRRELATRAVLITAEGPGQTKEGYEGMLVVLGRC